MTRNSIIDIAIFQQLLELDEDQQERDFTRPLVQTFSDEAKNTFAQISSALLTNPKSNPATIIHSSAVDDTEYDVFVIGRLAHKLKGSSISLGLRQMASTCEQMQHYCENLFITAQESMSQPTSNQSVTSQSVKLCGYDAEKLNAMFESASLEFQNAMEFFSSFYGIKF